MGCKQLVVFIIVLWTVSLVAGEGCSLSLDGTSYLAVDRFIWNNTQPFVALNDTLTIEAWINPSTPSFHENGIVLQTGIIYTNPQTSYELIYSYKYKSMLAHHWERAENSSWILQLVYSYVNVHPGTWTHVSYDTLAKRITINHRESGDLVFPLTTEPPPRFFAIGVNYTGYVDDIRVWNTSLSPEASKSGVCPTASGVEYADMNNLVLYLPFDGCEVNVTVDWSLSHACARMRDGSIKQAKSLRGGWKHGEWKRGEGKLGGSSGSRHKSFNNKRSGEATTGLPFSSIVPFVIASASGFHDWWDKQQQNGSSTAASSPGSGALFPPNQDQGETTTYPGGGLPNTGLPNTGLDTGLPNTGQPDAGLPNTGLDTGVSNTGLPNTGLPNTGLPNTGLPNTGLPNTGIPNTDIPDTGLPNTGIPETGLPNIDTGVPDIGIPNIGPPSPGMPDPDQSTLPTPGFSPSLNPGMPTTPGGSPSINPGYPGLDGGISENIPTGPPRRDVMTITYGPPSPAARTCFIEVPQASAQCPYPIAVPNDAPQPTPSPDNKNPSPKPPFVPETPTPTPHTGPAEPTPLPSTLEPSSDEHGGADHSDGDDSSSAHTQNHSDEGNHTATTPDPPDTTHTPSPPPESPPPKHYNWSVLYEHPLSKTFIMFGIFISLFSTYRLVRWGVKATKRKKPDNKHHRLEEGDIDDYPGAFYSVTELPQRRPADQQQQQPPPSQQQQQQPQQQQQTPISTTQPTAQTATQHTHPQPTPHPSPPPPPPPPSHQPNTPYFVYYMPQMQLPNQPPNQPPN